LSEGTKSKILKAIVIVLTVYFFLLSIKLLGHSFKLFGKGFAESMIQMTSNPFAGLFLGIVATSIIQSSSTTTSIVVGLVAGSALSLQNAIPIIMGANIGTTITNTIVSFAHVTNRIEFRRAFAAGIVHDFFNICAVLVLFPLEMNTHIISKSASILEKGFSGAGGLKMFNPLKVVIDPVIKLVDYIVSFLPYNHIILLIVSLISIFVALAILVKTMRSLVLNKLELIINKYLFRNDFLGLFMGIIMTAIVQSSSVTTSLIVPLAGAGIVTLRKIFPYMMGANIGTTITAILAAMATQNDIAVTVAFAHLCFNIFGIFIFYPLKFIPLKLAEFVSQKATTSTRNLVTFIIIYILLYFVPIVFIFF
jgi:sodium-dependent phosphate cotransporter